MITQKLIPLSFLAVLLGETAGDAVGPRCKPLKVYASGLYGLRVTYKDCDTGKIIKDSRVDPGKIADFKLDSSINSTDQLKITGIFLAADHLWQADSAANGWTVYCGGSVAFPDCIGIPGDVSNCKKLSVYNGGLYIAQVVYKQCGTGNLTKNELSNKEKGAYWVEPNTKIRIDMRSSDRIWPKDVAGEGQDIGNGYEIGCKGVYPSNKAFCDAAPTP